MKSVPLAFAYWAAETTLDLTAIWIMVSHGHPWWGMSFAIFAGLGANMNVKRYMGVPS